MKIKRKLQLGCGNAPLPVVEGWVNHDLFKHSSYVDVAFDLRVSPWPISEIESFSEILALDVFEHIPVECGIPFFDECWRLLEPNGTLFLRVPEFGSCYHLGDLTHVRGFGLNSFELLDPDSKTGQNNFYTTRFWRILKKKRPYPAQSLDQGRNLEFLFQKRI